MDGEKVLVTGGAGFLGSYLVERLCGRNEVSAIDDLSTGSLRNLAACRTAVRLRKASILNEKALGSVLKGKDVVYHLAAKVSAAESVEKPREYWRTNVEGTLNILKACVDGGVKRVVFVSSAAVYGDTEADPKVETMRPAPASPYATTKMVGEFACQEVSELRGIETVVLRVFNAYGPRQGPESPYASVTAKFSAAVAAGQPLDIYGDGEQTRDFLYAADVAEALELAGERPVAGETFNIASGTATSVNEVARLLSDIMGASVRAVRKAPRAGDVRHSRADIGKARTRLGFAPRTPLRQGLEATLSAFRAATRKAA